MKTNYYNNERIELFKFIPAGITNILDVGCGEGMFLNRVKEKYNIETWGIEIDTKASLIAKNNVDVVLSGDIESLINELPENYFDIITFNDVLEHLIAPENILVKIKSKLSTKGVVLASIPNVRYFGNIFNLLIKKDWKYEDAGILDKTHLRFFTKISMIRIFDQSGYSIQNMEGINKVENFKFKLLNFLFYNSLEDVFYIQFAIVAKSKKNQAKI